MNSLDPNFLDIKSQIQLGMWPKPDNMATAIAPYIRRLKTSESLIVVDVGVDKGETSYAILSDCPNVGKVYGVDTNKEETEEAKMIRQLLEANTKSFGDRFVSKETYMKKEFADVICVDSNSGLDKTLKGYYSKLKPSGIFCGNDHDKQEVKEALTRFRRENKIATPIQIINRSVWFWYKR